MATLLIEIPRAGDLENIMTAIRQLKGVKRVEVQGKEAFWRIQPLPATRAELMRELQAVESEHHSETTLLHPSVIANAKKRIAQWK